MLHMWLLWTVKVVWKLILFSVVRLPSENDTFAGKARVLCLRSVLAGPQAPHCRALATTTAGCSRYGFGSLSAILKHGVDAPVLTLGVSNRTHTHTLMAPWKDT